MPSGSRTQYLSLGVSALGLLALALAPWLPTERNLALGAKVSSSRADFSTAAVNVIDGNRYGQLGFHSQNIGIAELGLDLQKSHRLRRIEIYGRGDCCFEQSLPLSLEVSQDGKKFTPLARRTKAFSQYQPWEVRSDGVTARFLRLRGERGHYLVVSEVEVYGTE